MRSGGHFEFNGKSFFAWGMRFVAKGPCCFFVSAALLLFHGLTSAQGELEDRPITNISVTFEGADTDESATERFRVIARDALGERYSAVRLRTALSDLYETGQIISARAAVEDKAGGVELRFLIRRRTVAKRVSIRIEDAQPTVTEQELLLRVNLLDPDTTLDERTLQNNADLIVQYLRERGYYRAEARFEQERLQNDVEVAVIFHVTAGPQAEIEKFELNIAGVDADRISQELRLKPGSGFSNAALQAEIDRVRERLQDLGFLAPVLNEPRVIYDSETNSITVVLTGSSGPSVEIIVDTEKEKVSQATQNRLLPVRREGTLDLAAIIEGERRLENHFQEKGYFFVNVASVCSVTPPLTEEDSTPIPNDTEFTCSALRSFELAGKKVEVKYKVDLNRKLRLVDIRIRGTDQFVVDEVRSVLDSQEANIFGVIPLFGYGRGFTSERILGQDAETLRSLLRELGYREAIVSVNQGVSLDGESLIITFVIEQGPPTIISSVKIEGNKAFDDAELRQQLPDLVGANFSIAKIRNGQRRLAEHYSKAGYFDASVTFSIDEGEVNPTTGSHHYGVVYHIQNEGKPVYINRILVTGNERTSAKAIMKALTLKPDELLRSSDVYAGEQALYASDAFERVEIRQQPVGDRSQGGRLSDVIVDVAEQKPRLFQFGGGFSTDTGLSGFIDIRHFNLFGNLWQGGARVQASQRRQIVQFDFVNPRFFPDGEDRFAPLTLSAQFQRDSTVTRFFRSAFDRGTFGIVQRLDENGNPVDEFGGPAGSPTLNRLTFTAETNRTISLRDRSLLFLKYRFESVRLANIESLLIRDLLRPDDRIRISGFGATFVRDTRLRCNIEYSVLDIIARGEAGEPCRYNASDPTNGDYLTAEYNVSIPALGANIGFHKFQASYNYFHPIPGFSRATFAARGVIGLGSVFSSRARFSNVDFPELDGILPISERFFAGGSNTLRGFDFETAGPRVAIVPEGEFRNQNGEPVFLEPFTVPFGGNGLVVVNLEARIPLAKFLRAVPFYDGGNVFRKVGDIFNPPAAPPDDVFRQNLRARWTHTIGLGLRFKTPIGGEFGLDYGYLLNPPRFLIPQGDAPTAFFRLPHGQIHFRFSQAF